MIISTTCVKILNQLGDLVKQIDSKDYNAPCQALGKSTIGQHLRHTLEFFFCFEQGCQTGLINYDKRAHDKLIETDRFIALSSIERIIHFVSSLQTNRKMNLEVGYDLETSANITLETNTTRELVYNIEHAVHHMAIMKIGIREIAPYISLPSDFGVAASTIRHQAKVADQQVNR